MSEIVVYESTRRLAIIDEKAFGAELLIPRRWRAESLWWAITTDALDESIGYRRPMNEGTRSKISSNAMSSRISSNNCRRVTRAC
ncbi:hypothetical protein QFZ94_001182 [Paraburkholderia sp. JPY465]